MKSLSFIREKTAREFVLKLAFFLISLLLMAFGTALMACAELGLDSEELVIFGFKNLFGIGPEWQAVALFDGVFFLLLLAFFRRPIYFGMFIHILCFEPLIGLFEGWLERIIPKEHPLWAGILLSLAGVLVFGVAISFALSANFGLGIYDGVVMWVSHQLHISHMVGFWIVNALFVLLGFLFGGRINVQIGITTLLFGVFVGVVHALSFNGVEYLAEKLHVKEPKEQEL